VTTSTPPLYASDFLSSLIHLPSPLSQSYYSSLSPLHILTLTWFLPHRLNGGELFDYVVEKEYLDEKEAGIYMKQLLSAVDFFHKKGIVHLDLKVCCVNVLLIIIR